jgi:hypothetical protein
MPRVTVKRNPSGLPNARMQLRGISQRHARQVGPINLDDGKVRQRIRADELGGEDSAICHGDANVHRAVNDMVVGHDVAIGRDNHTAAQTVLNVGLRPHLLAEAVWPKAELFPEELLQAVGVVVAAVVPVFGRVRVVARFFRGDGYVDDRRSDACGQGLHSAIE